MGEKATCPYYDLSQDAAKPLFDSMSFFTFDKILGGACAAIAVIIIFLHMFNHATHLSVPREQLKIMRIALLIPSYSVFSLLCICFPQVAVYLLPWLEFFQSNSLAAYFLLLCEYVSPHDEERDRFFCSIELKDKKSAKNKPDGVEWLRQRWMGVFQYVVVTALVAIATAVTEALGVFCQYESKPGFAKLWLSIINTISPAIAFMNIVLVALTLKPHMPQHRPISKLLAIKLVVGLAFFQRIIFWILEATHQLNPTDRLTYADLNMGIPALLSCIEMVPISFLLVWAYPVAPYKYGPSGEAPQRDQGARFSNSYQGGFVGIRGFTGAVNPADTVKGVIIAIRMLFKNRLPPNLAQVNDRVRR